MPQVVLDLTESVAVLPTDPHRRRADSFDRPLRAAQLSCKLGLGQPGLAIDRDAHASAQFRGETSPMSMTSMRPSSA